MTDVPTPASHGRDGRPVERTRTSNPSSTLPLLYDLDALAQILVGEFTNDIPPASLGEFTKPRKTSAPTNAREAGPSLVPDGVGDQDEECDDESSSSEEDDEDDPRPRRGAGPRTLEEKLRGERAFIEELLDEDELEDLLNTAVPREQWKAADFVEEYMVYACVDVLVMETMCHLKTLEAKSTLKLYTSWIYHYKRWAAKMLKGIRDKLPTEQRTRHVDEIGHWIHCNKNEIAELGHWAIDKMTRAYITAIPVGVVMKKAGYSGAKQDYFLGRSRVPPSDELLELIAEHIFLGVDDLLKKIMRHIVAEDLAVKLVRTPSHPYVQCSKLYRIPLFQHWAKRVEKVNTETIKKRRDPTLIQPEEISVRMDAEHAVMSLTETLKYERERSAVQKIDLEEDIEKRDATIATLTAEITRLTEALRVSEARRMPEAPPAANEQSPSDGGSTESASTGAGAKKPPKPPQTVEEASYELNVVQPWRDATTVRDAWRLWTSCTSAEDTRRLCDRFAEPGFVDRHTLLKGATQGALGKRVRRMMKVIDAVRHLRWSDGEADTEAVIAALNKIAAEDDVGRHGPGERCWAAASDQDFDQAQEDRVNALGNMLLWDVACCR
ncbi:unnamed protein product [Closterium sp. Naga37s-1]|nr:unnamed protein product [Closterium sp. Naga37s-1]